MLSALNQTHDDRYTPDSYTKLANSLNAFYEITQIDVLFYSFTGVLVYRGDIITDNKVVQKTLDPEHFGKSIIFPIILNNQVWGFTMCSSAKSSNHRIQVSKEYLSNLFNSHFANRQDLTAQVLEPLTDEQLTKINYLSTLLQLKSSANNVLPIATAEDPQVRTSTEKFEAIRSIKEATNYICENLTSQLTLSTVAEHVFLSPSYLSRIFKKYMDINFINYINQQKIAHAQRELILSRKPINLIPNIAGFSQTSYFTKIFKKITGTTPSKYRKENAAISRIYTIHHTLDWPENASVFDVSKTFFTKQNLDYYYESANGYLYVNSIGDLTDANEKSGWIFTVDGRQPTNSADLISTKGVSVVQWMYVDFR
ncbi:helix-turn-helix domain-containing protein [Pediococcus acidilactici]|uniref:helix-turn-helix domain-containing protein n=1 Tax=Pediococcus acidilactici TaxID=1254 RepID=UPI000466FC08|nr:helix-turn-helix domain-containing protein [Pediococcus acidilactici]MCF4061919.1 helix-turn-helix domain-containing protein [Pediococcus acidilactici]QZQ46842.1 transcriptional regulator [Pediococcus acidilactici]